MSRDVVGKEIGLEGLKWKMARKAIIKRGREFILFPFVLPFPFLLLEEGKSQVKLK